MSQLLKCISILFATALVSIPGHAQGTSNDKKCGFDSAEEFMLEVDQTLNKFLSYQTFDPTHNLKKFSLQTQKEMNRKIRQRSKKLSQENAKKSFSEAEQATFEIVENFRKNDLLKILVHEDFLQTEITQKGCGGAIACANSDSFSIGFNKVELEKLYHSVGPQNFNYIITAIVGHEIGHFIHFYVLEMEKLEPFNNDNMLKYHNLVDGLGMRLANYSIHDFVNALVHYKNDGDIPYRLACFEKFILEKNK